MGAVTMNEFERGKLVGKTQTLENVYKIIDTLFMKENSVYINCEELISKLEDDEVEK
jgi:hypothetical protein